MSLTATLPPELLMNATDRPASSTTLSEERRTRRPAFPRFFAPDLPADLPLARAIRPPVSAVRSESEALRSAPRTPLTKVSASERREVCRFGMAAWAYHDSALSWQGELPFSRFPNKRASRMNGRAGARGDGWLRRSVSGM